MRDGVVWVTSEVPDRDGGGGNIRQAHLLVALAEHTPVDLLVAGDVARPRGGGRRSPHHLRSTGLGSRRVTGFPSGGGRVHGVGPPPAPRRGLHAQVRAALSAELVGLAADAQALLLHHQVLGPLLEPPRPPGPRWALTLFHASGDRSFQEAAVEPSRLQRALLRKDGRNAERAEHRYVDAADRLVVLSEEDGRRLGRPGTPTHLVQQGVDLRRFPISPLTKEPMVLFPGSLDYSPNVDGSVWFVETMWPAIRAARARRAAAHRRSPATERGAGAAWPSGCRGAR